MNRIRCRFCGKKHKSEAFSVVCSCGHKARLLYQVCVVCEKKYWSTVKRSKCLSCFKSEDKETVEYQCKKGHEFKAAKGWRAKCPVCGDVTSRRKQVCRCGKSYFGTIKNECCPVCTMAEKQTFRRGNLFGVVSGVQLSDDQQLATDLCAKSPRAVHKFIWAEIYRHPKVAERIAKEAKTATQAAEIVNEENMKYFKERSSFGVACYE